MVTLVRAMAPPGQEYEQQYPYGQYPQDYAGTLPPPPLHHPYLSPGLPPGLIDFPPGLYPSDTPPGLYPPHASDTADPTEFDPLSVYHQIQRQQQEYIQWQQRQQEDQVQQPQTPQTLTLEENIEARNVLRPQAKEFIPGHFKIPGQSQCREGWGPSPGLIQAVTAGLRVKPKLQDGIQEPPQTQTRTPLKKEAKSFKPSFQPGNMMGQPGNMMGIMMGHPATLKQLQQHQLFV